LLRRLCYLFEADPGLVRLARTAHAAVQVHWLTGKFRASDLSITIGIHGLEVAFDHGPAGLIDKGLKFIGRYETIAIGVIVLEIGLDARTTHGHSVAALANIVLAGKLPVATLHRTLRVRVALCAGKLSGAALHRAVRVRVALRGSITRRIEVAVGLLRERRDYRCANKDGYKTGCQYQIAFHDITSSV